MIVRVVIVAFAIVFATPSVPADLADDHFGEMVQVAKRAALNRDIDMKHYMLSGRSWLSAESEWTIRFVGWGPQEGHFLHVLIRDDTKQAKVVADREIVASDHLTNR